MTTMANSTDERTARPSIIAELGQSAASRADELDRTCDVPSDLYRAAAAASLFRQLVPGEMGGLGSTPLEWFRTGVELARHAASFGWVVTQGAAEMAWIAAGADSSWVTEFLADPLATSASTTAGMGSLTPDDDGYRFGGRWSFNTGCRNASWIGGSAVVIDPSDGQGREVRWAWVPADRAGVLDDWNPSGLRGTGSHSVSITDQHVPAAWTFSPFVPTGNDRGPYRCAVGNGNWLIATAVAATQLGNARGALDSARSVIASKAPSAFGTPLVDNTAVQRRFTEIEGRWLAARAGVERELDSLWCEAIEHEQLSVDQRVRMHRANAVANELAVRVVDAATHICGSVALSRTHVLARCQRDAQALRTHIAVAGTSLEQNARLAFGTLDQRAAILV